MYLVDIILLVGALILAIIALVRGQVPYLTIAVLLIAIDLVIHLAPLGKS